MNDDNRPQILIDVGQRIRQARRDQNLRLTDLALLTGISAPALSLIETAKRDARLTSLARIASALRVPLSDLVGDSGGRENSSGGKPDSGYDLSEYV